MIQALLVAVVAFLASIDEQTFGACMMSRPLFTGPIVGLIMGDVTTGIIIGASLEAMFMGDPLWLEVRFHRKFMRQVFLVLQLRFNLEQELEQQ